MNAATLPTECLKLRTDNAVLIRIFTAGANVSWYILKNYLALSTKAKYNAYCMAFQFYSYKNV